VSPTVIHIQDAWKAYGRIQALRGLSITVPAQSVYCFLGPNGAGKTTTVRLILGLQRPDRGAIALFDCPVATNRCALLRRTGALVESPCAYSHLTGRENLEVHRRILGLPKAAIDRALETVDLQQAAGRAVNGYSQGMKQRLGLAFALIGRPDLLVLDEPTNGLDPAGIREVRALICDMPRKHGTTVFLSSHLLSEVEQMATHIAVISRGHLKFQGTREDLNSMKDPGVMIEVDLPERAVTILSAAGYHAMSDGRRIRVGAGPSVDPGHINTTLVRAGLTVSHISLRNVSLEEIFLDLTGGE
jgi:lantibiotic transport system ATP-binding protein